MSRTTIDIRTPDGICPASVFRPSSGKGPWPAVIFFMDGIGIRPVLFEMGQRLADAGYVVLLPDGFYRAGPYAPHDPKEIFGDQAKRDAFFAKYFASTNNTKAGADTASYLDAISAMPDVSGPGVVCTGYCMGGAISMTVAGLYPGRIVGAASFHAGNLASDAPDSPHRLMSKIKGRVFVAGADKDDFFPPEQKQIVETTLTEAGVDHVVTTYEGALHGWTMKDFPVYNEAAAERHWRDMLAFFAESLK